MYQVTKIQLELLDLEELKKIRDAMRIIMELGVWEMDIDSRQLVNELIPKKEASKYPTP